MIRRLLLLGVVSLVVLGCRSREYSVAPVSGKVTLDGKPLVGAAVMFQPSAQGKNINPGPGSYGITDAEGRYTLVLIGEESKGAAVGKHKVRISDHDDTKQAADDDSPVKRKKSDVKVPPKYNAVEALFEFEVPSKGSSEANFDLTSK